MSDPIPTASEPHTPIGVAARSRLPQETVRDVRWRDVAAVVVAPLLVVALVNLSIALILRAHPSNRGDWLARAKWQLLLGDRAPVDTLILGDSTCNQGVNPKLFVHALGGAALNLCTTGDKLAVGDAWMLQAYLKRQAPPQRVVVMHAYDVWARDDQTLRKVAWTLGEYRAHFEDAAPQIPWTLGERILLRLGPWAPLYNQPQASLDVVRDVHAALNRKRFKITADGFMGYNKPNPKRVANDAREHLAKLASDRAPISPINHEALKTLMALAQQHRVPLYVAHAPLFEGLWNDKRFRRRHKSLSRALERALDASPHARLLSRTPATFSDKEMENADHVIGAASVRLTEQLIDAIREIETK